MVCADRTYGQTSKLTNEDTGRSEVHFTSAVGHPCVEIGPINDFEQTLTVLANEASPDSSEAFHVLPRLSPPPSPKPRRRHGAKGGTLYLVRCPALLGASYVYAEMLAAMFKQVSASANFVNVGG